MNMIWIVAAAVAAFGIGAALALLIGRLSHRSKKSKSMEEENADKDHRPTVEELQASYAKLVNDEVYHIFSEDFHEGLRKQARTDLEKIVSENAMFLKQDLQMTASGISEFVKSEITTKLQEELAAYEQAVRDVQQQAIDTIKQSIEQTQQQQAALQQQIATEAAAQKARMLQTLEENLADIVNHYLLEAVGSQLDLKAQMPMILHEMEKQKPAMAKDMML